jgi:hypothetical protein
LFVTDSSAYIGGHVDDFDPTELVATTGGSIEASEGVHQRGLARTARTDQGGVFTPLHHKVYAIEGSDFDLFESIDFRDIDEFDKGLV